MEKLYSELKSVWPTYSDEARDNWVILLGGKKDKSEVMALFDIFSEERKRDKRKDQMKIYEENLKNCCIERVKIQQQIANGY